ncbi:hypothetical protein [Telluribacter sp.]|uniref:hypothetical protein n=1 Tax=Telluribacter sp. TaxID=1978767 RepID=UPI002E0F6307|nr:hypothetical protein [Telluribacter sp.]
MVVTLWWAFYQWRGHPMSTNSMAPFLSTAQHLTRGGDFLIDVEDVRYFKGLDDVVEEDQYIFRTSSTPQQYIYDPIGYPYLIMTATVLFPWLGHQLAIILLQCMIHILLCLAVLRAYMYGNYLLLVWVLIEVVHEGTLAPIPRFRKLWPL